MFNTRHKQHCRYTAYALVFLLTLVSFGNTGLTEAYYSDTETSGVNLFEAAELDFILTNTVNNFGGLTPNNSTFSFPVVVSTTTGSLPFAYDARATNQQGALCEVLQFEGFLENVLASSSALGLFTTSSTTFPFDGDSWGFTASLGAVDESYSNTTCVFDVVFDGWQFNYSSDTAFHDTEKVTFTIQAGVWGNVPGVDAVTSDIAAIKDADVSELKPATNNGNAHALTIGRQSGKDSEAFIGFDYVLPAGSEVVSAALKTYLFTAPTPNTNYQASRVTSAWNEGLITWNTKPATTPTNTISTGDGNAKWLSWDVTADVKDYVELGGSNFGWKIADIDPLPSGARSGQILSSEHQSQEESRPVLEVAFDAPVATTNHLVINEVFFDVDSNHGSDANNEWIELYNPTANPISIQDWDICDGVSCVNMSVATTVPAYGFIVLVEDASTYTKWSIPASAKKIALNTNLGAGLNDGGDKVQLKDASNVVVDQISYGTDTSVFNPAIAITGLDGKSVARIVKGFDTDTVADWIFNATPNPGTNPGSDAIEMLRFTNAGVEVAPVSVGLDALPQLSPTEIELLQEETIALQSETADTTTDTNVSTPGDYVFNSDVMDTSTSTETVQQQEQTVVDQGVPETPTDIVEAREEDVTAPTQTEAVQEFVDTEEVIVEEEPPVESAAASDTNTTI